MGARSRERGVGFKMCGGMGGGARERGVGFENVGRAQERMVARNTHTNNRTCISSCVGDRRGQVGLKTHGGRSRTGGGA